ncbi:hypothetical protein IJJ18_00105, partial [Candidatus Saccharibacteria bacterium]|nr:hypothetical protein [Candidatus Saccharibacteria bacterium]
MKKQTNKKTVYAGFTAALGLAAFSAAIISPSIFATSTSGNVQLDTEVATSIAMKIASPNDTNPECMTQPGVTYGEANRYATSNGAEGSKQVDTFDGTVGGADEINTNTSCAMLTMNPNAYDSTYSDVTVYTNSGNGYALTLEAAEPNLVNTTDNTQYIPAGTLTEQDGTGAQAGTRVVPGGQNLWSYKTDNGIITSWTPVSSTAATIRAYDQETSGGETTRVTYGVSSGNNPTGKYATTLTYTATMFDGNNPYVGDVEIEDVPNASVSPSSLSIAKGQSKTITITPETGYYLSSFTCPTGYECTGYTTDKGDSASAAAQTITIKSISASSTPVNISFTVAPLKTLADLTYMQDMTSTYVSGVSVGDSATLTDTRDNKTYTVKKLNDGNIWMTQNLRLVGSKTLTSADSNVTTSFNLTASNSGTWCQENSSACDDQ